MKGAARKNRIESEMAQRAAKIQENKISEAAEKKFVVSLNRHLDAYRNEQKTVLNDLEDHQKLYDAKMKFIQKNITER